MAETTEIAWTDSTFNPWVGCTNVSAGCDHCYAEAMNNRRGWTEWGSHGARRRTATWHNPIKWQRDAARFQREHGRRQRVFCASLADVFDNQAPADWRAELWALIYGTPDLDWQLLTKRPQNIGKMLPPDWGAGWPNVWLGTTTENQEEYRRRWSILREVPAAIRFISYEPAIGPLRLRDVDYGLLPDWVIYGGESGPGARVADPEWIREIMSDCVVADIPFFLKQHGAYPSNPLVHDLGFSIKHAMARDPPTNGKGGALFLGVLWRAFPKSATPARFVEPQQEAML